MEIGATRGFNRTAQDFSIMKFEHPGCQSALICGWGFSHRRLPVLAQWLAFAHHDNIFALPCIEFEQWAANAL